MSLDINISDLPDSSELTRPPRGGSVDIHNLYYLAGVVLGGVVALLYAPKSGKKTREFINEKTGEGKEVLAETSKEVYERDRKLNLNLSAHLYEELMALANEQRISMTELIRLGLGLFKLACEESGKGHRLILTTEDGRSLQEVAIPHG